MLESSVRLVREPSVTEFDLGNVAHFTRTPIGSALDTDDAVKRVTVAVACYKRKHLSVFEFADLLFDVQCPIFVARQLVRHRNGVFMEKSLRYMEAPALRAGEDTGRYEKPLCKENDYIDAYADALDLYKRLVESGERKEMARAVLPLCTPTEFLWKINLRSLLNVFDQRLNPCAQRETRAVVQSMFDLASQYYPNILHEWKIEHGIN